MLRGFWKRWLSLLVFVLASLVILWLVLKKITVSSQFPVKQSFKWLDVNNSTRLKYCRYSKQGPGLMADEKGYVCEMADFRVSGCCNPEGNSTKLYSCLDCQPNCCCKRYEHCISCCLHPKNRQLLEHVLELAKNFKSPLLLMVDDSFNLCLHKCRTSSTSVVSENKYINSVYKYCYGTDPPEVSRDV